MENINAIVAVLILVVAIAGCTGKPSYSSSSANEGTSPQLTTASSQTEVQQTTTTIQETSVQTLGLWLAMGKNWNSDPDVDGIEVTISPKDTNDNLIRTSGTISAKLWYSDLDSTFSKRVKEEFLEEWTNVPVNRDNYDYPGAKIRLEYKPEVKQSIISQKKYQTGWLEITLTTPDGKNFAAKDDSVYILGLG